MRPRLPAWILFFCVSALPVSSQRGFAQTSTSPRYQRGDVTAPIGNEDDARNRIANEMAKRAAKERVAALKHDTDKLLKLSVELKEFVDKSDENVLSVDVIKKAEEIEKLAKSVKEKMKGAN